MAGTHPIRSILGAIRPRRFTPALQRALHASRLARLDRSAVAQMANLHEFTRRTLQMNLSERPGPQLAEHLHTLFKLDAVAIFDADLGEIYRAGEWTIHPDELVQNVYHFESSSDDPLTGISRRVVRLGIVPIGSLVVRGEISPLVCSTLASVIGITFDRYRATANESRIEAERDAEQMRATVLDNLAHAYKTPLTAIRAASSGLSEMGRLSPAQAELVSLIDEQANLLNELTTRLLTTARLEADGPQAPALALRVEAISAGALIEEVVTGLGERSAGANIQIEIPEDGLVLHGDRRLLAALLTQYVDNACKYSDAGAPITVRVERSAKDVLFSVHSLGSVIPTADRERIFDRYYRSASSSTRAAGTGIGLSIAKRAALAHQGAVWVTSDETHGTTFFAAIPDHSQVSKGPGGAPPADTQRSTP